MKKILLAVSGIFLVVLGVIGIVLPVLPTTPFLLLASWCFFRSSDRLHRWLLEHPVLGKYIYNYITYRAVPMKTKIFAVALLWTSILFSIYITAKLWLAFLLLGIAVGVSIHILSLKTLRIEDTLENPGGNRIEDLPASGEPR